MSNKVCTKCGKTHPLRLDQVDDKYKLRRVYTKPASGVSASVMWCLLIGRYSITKTDRNISIPVPKSRDNECERRFTLTVDHGHFKNAHS